MSDFLVHLNPAVNGEALLNLLKRPFGDSAPRGTANYRAWGVVALLENNIGKHPNSITLGDWTFAWVGELIIAQSRPAIEAALKQLSAIPAAGSVQDTFHSLKGLFGTLNGAFTAILF